MIPRYTRPEMAALWTDEFRWQTILDVELLAAEAYARTPEDRRAVKTLRRRAKVDVARILEIEKTTKHDLIAFLTQIEEKAGPAAKVLHRGLTSSDVLDTALAVQMARAADLLIVGIERLRAAVKKLARAHAATPMMGRSHGVHGEPITFGFKVAGWYTELTRGARRLAQTRAEVAFGKLSGAMGNFAHLDPSVEAAVCRRLGLRPEPVSTQVVPRDRHAHFVQTLALVAAGLERIATEIRHLQRTEVLEVEEPFSKGQKGSSAMPHKRNPIASENICGLARLLRAHSLAALENVALWHERDISHSSVERVILPDATILLDYMLHRLAGVIDGLQVHPERMAANMEKTADIVCSQRVVVALAKKGLPKQQAYEIVQGHALAAWTAGTPFRPAVSNDARVRERLSPGEIAACFDRGSFYKNAARAVARATKE
ncbi:MAG: adenylosuccinate lyase [Elusimicrobia bacterium]|nr:adenylosuccinate lyase [Elusimicrobiota bacterium]MBK7689007.1 adenylosuccinate lyase [Elusimicrobiota bacterium]